MPPRVNKRPEYFTAVREWFNIQASEDEPDEPAKQAQRDRVDGLTEDEREAYYEVVGQVIRGKQNLDLKDRRI